MKNWLERKYNVSITKSKFNNVNNRDVFGDISLELDNEDFDIDETVNDIVNTIFRAYSKRKDFIK